MLYLNCAARLYISNGIYCSKYIIQLCALYEAAKNLIIIIMITTLITH